MSKKGRFRRPTARPLERLSRPPTDDPAIEEALSRETAKACVALRQGRGEMFSSPRTKTEPWRVLDELDVMLQRGEIDDKLYRAGRRYGGRYREAILRNVATSSLRANDRQGNQDGAEIYLSGRIITMKKLARDRACFAINPRIGKLCDDVFGEDYRLSEGPARSVGVDVLVWALTRLCYHYGVMWVGYDRAA
jgi:hypothetical protein